MVEELRRVMAFREKSILENVKAFAAQQREHDEQKQKYDSSQPDSSSLPSAAAINLPPSIRDPRILGVCLSSRRNMCISGDHFVLTRIGWKSIRAMAVGDEVLSLNIDKDTKGKTSWAQEWKTVRNVTSHRVDPNCEADKLYRILGSGMDIIATHDHRMLIARLPTRESTGLQKTWPVGYDTVGELLPPALTYSPSPSTSNANAYKHSQVRAVPRAGINKQPDVRIVIPGLERVCEWWWSRLDSRGQPDRQLGLLHFIGFWLGDGYLGVWHGLVCIGQKKGPSLEWLEALLQDVFPRWVNVHSQKTRPGSVIHAIRCPPLYNYLRLMAVGPLGYNPRDKTHLRNYPHFAADSELADVERQSDYYASNSAAHASSTWTEEQMLAALKGEVQPKEEELPEEAFGDVAQVPLGEPMATDDAVCAAQWRRAGRLVIRNGGLFLIINGHWFYLKRWMGDAQQMASVYSQLSRQQAVALLDGFCRADRTWDTVEYHKKCVSAVPRVVLSVPKGAWYCSNSSMPLIQNLMLIGQLAEAAIYLKRMVEAGKTTNIDGRDVTYSVDHWQLSFTFNKSERGIPFSFCQLPEPRDVSGGGKIDERGYFDYKDDSEETPTVYCVEVDGNSNFLTQRLARSIGHKGNMGVRARPVFVGNCTHPDVSSFDNRNKVDALCRNLTASFIREQHAQGAGVPICEYFEGFEREGKEAQLLGVYSLADLKVLGQDKGWCPYFYARYAINMANVVVYNYQYMLDPKISGLVSREMEKESIVVFDEAHNIDNSQTIAQARAPAARHHRMAHD